ncbi:MAG: hypothetical protein MPJ24_02970 [Pirellulaceae bacterium]|nr:hypothetical protein [Pirellulaceae bacterium]
MASKNPEVSVDRRNKKQERRQNDLPVENDRRKVQRRRQIDPTTCERDYNDAEIEFMQTLDAYKRKSGRMFPTCSEILEVLYSLGYRQLDQESLADFPIPGKSEEAKTDEEDLKDEEE